MIEQFAKTGHITDATTNPLFVAQAGLSGDPAYQSLVDSAVEYACGSSCEIDWDNMDMPSAESACADFTALAMDALAVQLGSKITQIVDGYVSTEVDPRLSFDTEETLVRARRIIEMYEEVRLAFYETLCDWQAILSVLIYLCSFSSASPAPASS